MHKAITFRHSENVFLKTFFFHADMTHVSNAIVDKRTLI
jgi:hypothetical protein